MDSYMFELEREERRSAEDQSSFHSVTGTRDLDDVDGPSREDLR